MTNLEGEARLRQIEREEDSPELLTEAELDQKAQEAFEQHGLEIFANTVTQLGEAMRDEPQPVTEATVQQALAAEAAETDQELPQFTPEENPFAGTSFTPDAANEAMIGVAEAMEKELQQALQETGNLVQEGKFDEAAGAVQAVVGRMEQAGFGSLPKEAQQLLIDLKANLDAVLSADSAAAKEKLYRFACGAADFIPVVGPAKMAAEAAYGRTLGGNDLAGWGRLLHGTEGVVFLAVDLTGYGALGTKGFKVGELGFKLGPKLITRTAAFMRSVGVARDVYRPLFDVGVFVAKHPAIAEAATKGLLGLAAARSARTLTELPALLRPAAADAAIDPVANTADRPGRHLGSAEATATTQEAAA